MASSLLLISAILVMTGVSQGQHVEHMKQNLTKITWDHAVNSWDQLKNALASKVAMIEADILMGTVNGDFKVIPIMAHPPRNTSDLSLEWFMRNVSEYNSKNPNDMKGVKLDFKSIDAFETSISIIMPYSSVNYPIWINADIFKGPFKPEAVPVDPNRFLVGCKSFPKATVSIGWTTFFNKTYKNESYQQDQINEMVLAIRTHAIRQNITFPVRAAYAQNSVDVLKKLVEDKENYTLTVWSGKEDIVDIPKLRHFILSVGIDKTYVDVPEEIYSKLRLDKSGGNSMKSYGLFIVIFSIFIYFLSINLH